MKTIGWQPALSRRTLGSGWTVYEVSSAEIRAQDCHPFVFLHTDLILSYSPVIDVNCCRRSWTHQPPRSNIKQLLARLRSSSGRQHHLLLHGSILPKKIFPTP